MKQILLIAALAVCFYGDLFSQASGSFFSLKLGGQTCLFRYKVVTDSSSQLYSKGKGATNQYLDLQNAGTKTFKIRSAGYNDTVTMIDPVTLNERTSIVNHDNQEYHIESEMSYFDFLLLLRSKFELKNPQKSFRVYSYRLYYESQDSTGYLEVNYPHTSEGVISKLNCLDKGGVILLSLTAADHDRVRIDEGGSWLALIRIKK